MDLLATLPPITDMAVSPDCLYIAASCRDGSLRTYALKTWSPVGIPLRGSSKTATCVAWSTNLLYLVSGYEDGTVVIWDASKWQKLFKIKAHLDATTCIAASSKYVASGGKDGVCNLYSLENGHKVGSSRLSNWEVTHIRFMTDDLLLVRSKHTDIRQFSVPGLVKLDEEYEIFGDNLSFQFCVTAGKHIVQADEWAITVLGAGVEEDIYTIELTDGVHISEYAGKISMDAQYIRYNETAGTHETELRDGWVVGFILRHQLQLFHIFIDEVTGDSYSSMTFDFRGQDLVACALASPPFTSHESCYCAPFRMVLAGNDRNNGWIRMICAPLSDHKLGNGSMWPSIESHVPKLSCLAARKAAELGLNLEQLPDLMECQVRDHFYRDPDEQDNGDDFEGIFDYPEGWY